MSEASLSRARLELELREAQQELARLEAERLRLARKNEALAEALLEVCHVEGLPPLILRVIEQALAFDGQPWSLQGAEPDAEPDADTSEP